MVSLWWFCRCWVRVSEVVLVLIMMIEVFLMRFEVSLLIFFLVEILSCSCMLSFFLVIIMVDRFIVLLWVWISMLLVFSWLRLWWIVFDEILNCVDSMVMVIWLVLVMKVVILVLCLVGSCMSWLLLLRVLLLFIVVFLVDCVWLCVDFCVLMGEWMWY